MLLRPFGAMNGCRGGSSASIRRGVAALPLNGAGRIPVNELSGIGVAGSAAPAAGAAVANASRPVRSTRASTRESYAAGR